MVTLQRISRNVKAHLPFNVDSIEYSVSKTYMDSAGRSTVNIKARNLVEDHVRELFVEYEYPESAYLIKPLAAASMVMGVFFGFDGLFASQPPDPGPGACQSKADMICGQPRISLFPTSTGFNKSHSPAVSFLTLSFFRVFVPEDERTLQSNTSSIHHTPQFLSPSSILVRRNQPQIVYSSFAVNGHNILASKTSVSARSVSPALIFHHKETKLSNDSPLAFVPAC